MPPQRTLCEGYKARSACAPRFFLFRRHTLCTNFVSWWASATYLFRYKYYLVSLRNWFFSQILRKFLEIRKNWSIYGPLGWNILKAEGLAIPFASINRFGKCYISAFIKICDIITSLIKDSRDRCKKKVPGQEIGNS